MHVPCMDPSGILCVFTSYQFIIFHPGVAGCPCGIQMSSPCHFLLRSVGTLQLGAFFAHGNGLHDSGVGTSDLPLSHLVPPAPTAKSLGLWPHHWLWVHCIRLDSWMTCNDITLEWLVENIYRESSAQRGQISLPASKFKLDQLPVWCFLFSAFKALMGFLFSMIFHWCSNSVREPLCINGTSINHITTPLATIRCTGHDKVSVAWQLQGTRPAPSRSSGFWCLRASHVALFNQLCCMQQFLPKLWGASCGFHRFERASSDWGILSVFNRLLDFTWQVRVRTTEANAEWQKAKMHKIAFAQWCYHYLDQIFDKSM